MSINPNDHYVNSCLPRLKDIINLSGLSDYMTVTMSEDKLAVHAAVIYPNGAELETTVSLDLIHAVRIDGHLSRQHYCGEFLCTELFGQRVAPHNYNFIQGYLTALCPANTQISVRGYSQSFQILYTIPGEDAKTAQIEIAFDKLLPFQLTLLALRMAKSSKCCQSVDWLEATNIKAGHIAPLLDKFQFLYQLR